MRRLFGRWKQLRSFGCRICVGVPGFVGLGTICCQLFDKFHFFECVTLSKTRQAQLGGDVCWSKGATAQDPYRGIRGVCDRRAAPDEYTGCGRGRIPRACLPPTPPLSEFRVDRAGRRHAAASSDRRDATVLRLAVHGARPREGV